MGNILQVYVEIHHHTGVSRVYLTLMMYLYVDTDLVLNTLPCTGLNNRWERATGEITTGLLMSVHIISEDESILVRFIYLYFIDIRPVQSFE